jgi:hypothetical protein
MNERTAVTSGRTIAQKEQLEERIEALAWGLILIVSGAALSLPGWKVPVGGWLAAMGVILIGLNLARRWMGVETGRCTTLLGVAALTGGVAVFLGLGLLVFPLMMVLAGGWIIVAQFLARTPSGAA